MTKDQSACDRDNVADVSTVDGVGLLASVVSRQRRVGGRRCPWRVSVAAGQTIQVALLHYRHLEVDTRLEQSEPCVQVARIFEHDQVSLKCSARVNQTKACTCNTYVCIPPSAIQEWYTNVLKTQMLLMDRLKLLLCMLLTCT